MLDPSLEGFKQEGPLTVYNRENIFNYINGEAEVYLPHGFRLLFTLNFRKKEGGALMTVDIYDMSSSPGARAVLKKFSEDGGLKIEELGEAALTDNITVLIQQGRYFVRILPGPEETIPKVDDMIRLGKALDNLLSFSHFYPPGASNR